jgi:hypothetical protein
MQYLPSDLLSNLCPIEHKQICRKLASMTVLGLVKLVYSDGFDW